jgi:CDP-diacylglycerol--glycerol-3-phosphate 3-phosphatidyltransferase
MRFFPLVLTTLRLILGPVALTVAISGGPRWTYLLILVIATLSDIYDGILARRLGVATPALRRYDSITDLIFYLFILDVVWKLNRTLLIQNWPWLTSILVSEAAVILLCFAKFGKYPSTHSYLAKCFGLCLLAALIAVLVFKAGSWTIISLAIIALITNTEILAIHLLMSEAPVDVKSVFNLPRVRRAILGQPR